MCKKVIKIDPQQQIKTSHYHSGAVKSQISYMSGKRHGMATWRRENSKKRWQEMYRTGDLHGVETYWYENGQKEREIYYNSDKEYARIEWDEEGDVAKAKLPTRSSIINPAVKSKKIISSRK